jgi:3',5'-cyclic AMP phosphodiesterase CpdA
VKWRIRLRTHSFQELAAAAAAIKKKAFLTSPFAPVLICTGDITTAGNTYAFALGRAFLEDEWVEDNSDRIERHKIGLAASKMSGLVVVPGNHDRFSSKSAVPQLQKDYSSFERAFDGVLAPKRRMFDEPYELAPADAYRVLPTLTVVRSSPSTGVSLAVLSLDSNELTPDEILNPSSSVARGRISSASLGLMREMISGIRRRPEKVTDTLGRTYDLSSDRIVVAVALHHHPIPLRAVDTGNLHELLNAEDLLDACDGCKVDLVLFGHMHSSEVSARTNAQDGHRTIFVSAPSLCCPSRHRACGFTSVDITADALLVEEWSYVSGLFSRSRIHHFDLPT